MARGLDQFGWTMLIVPVLRHHYFCAHIAGWTITTVDTMKTLAFNVEETEVRI